MSKQFAESLATGTTITSVYDALVMEVIHCRDDDSHKVTSVSFVVSYEEIERMGVSM